VPTQQAIKSEGLLLREDSDMSDSKPSRTAEIQWRDVEIIQPPLYPSETVDFFDTLATPKQMKWCEPLAGEALARFGVPVDCLTKRQASELLKEARDA
jgi:hypothetical protein